MTFEGPPRRFYEPGSPSLDIPGEGEGGVWILLSTPSLRASGWAERAAVALVERWSAAGERVLLADLALSNPRLHTHLHMPNGEGVSDVLLYGASLGRVASTTPGGYLFVSAGTPVADGREVLGGERWGAISEGFVAAGARFVAFLPTDEPGRESATHWGERMLLLAEDEHDAFALLGDSAGLVAAVLSPPLGPAFAPEGAGEPAAGGVDHAGGVPDATAAADPDRDVAGLDAAADPASARPSPTPPMGHAPTARAGITESPWFWTLLVLVLVMVLLAALGLVRIPTLGGSPASGSPARVWASPVQPATGAPVARLAASRGE